MYEAVTSPYITCLSCLLVQNYDCDLWGEDLTQMGECEECSHARCWRQGACACRCHMPDTHDQNTP
jgi:hypothetical protein